MKEIKIGYNTVSPARQRRRNRMQLFGAAFGILAGFWETFGLYKGIYIVIPVSGFILAGLNIIIGRFYDKVENKYGNRLDIILSRINGFVLLITGIGFHVTGSKYIQYAYYLLSLLFLIVFPYLLFPVKGKKLYMRMTDSGIIVNRLIFKDVIYPWQVIKSVFINENALQVQTKNGKKTKKYFIQDADKSKFPEIYSFINMIKSENEY